MIKTKKFQPTKKEYFSFMWRILLKKRWWLFAFMWLLTIAILFKDEKDSSDTFLIIFSIAYPLLILFQYWRFVNSEENLILFKERQHEVFNDKIISHFGETTESTIAMENFIKTFELSDVYLLYISKGESIYFPKRAFETKVDENWFRNEVFLKIKNR